MKCPKCGDELVFDVKVNIKACFCERCYDFLYDDNGKKIGVVE